jgi:hypothetical protein
MAGEAQVELIQREVEEVVKNAVKEAVEEVVRDAVEQANSRAPGTRHEAADR